MVKRPANVEDLESHNGAETMPRRQSVKGSARRCNTATILVQDVQAFLDQQRCVENDQAVADGKHVIAGAGLEEGANGPLRRVSLVLWACCRA